MKYTCSTNKLYHELPSNANRSQTIIFLPFFQSQNPIPNQNIPNTLTTSSQTPPTPRISILHQKNAEMTQKGNMLLNEQIEPNLRNTKTAPHSTTYRFPYAELGRRDVLRPGRLCYLDIHDSEAMNVTLLIYTRLF